jgi:hypothetical protein
MRRYSAVLSGPWRSRTVIGLSLALGLGLSGCGTVGDTFSGIDDTLFGSDTDTGTEASTAPQSNQQQADQDTDTGAQGTLPGAPGTPADNGTPGAMASEGVAPAIGITPIPIEPGADTGTGVGHTVQTLRTQVSSLQDRLVAQAQELANLRATSSQASMQYHDAKANISARLQLGTTRGNPELVAQWNTAQSALDLMTTNINSEDALATQIADESSTAHFTLNTIEATFNISGAVDEDHRQLKILADETNQIIILIDSLMSTSSDMVQRQTAYVANERASMVTLASAIKNGDFYGDLGMLSGTGGAAPASFATSTGGPALVTIRFDHPHVDYQQILYTAVAEALQARPKAAFVVAAVAPTRGSVSAVQLAESEAERHAQDVIRSLTDMGVPASRLNITSSTDPGLSSSEVRVYVR